VRPGDSQKQFDGCNRDQKDKKGGRTRMEDKAKTKNRCKLDAMLLEML
jgi:hypothetical protein